MAYAHALHEALTLLNGGDCWFAAEEVEAALLKEFLLDAAQPQPPLARRARRVLSRRGAAATCFAGTSQRCPPAQAPFAVLSSLVGSRSLSSLRARNKTTRNSIRQ